MTVFAAQAPPLCRRPPPASPRPPSPPPAGGGGVIKAGRVCQCFGVSVHARPWRRESSTCGWGLPVGVGVKGAGSRNCERWGACSATKQPGGGAGGGGGSWQSPADRATHSHPPGKTEIDDTGRKLEAGFRYANCLALTGVALEGKGPRRRPQKRLDRRLEGVAKAVGGGYCRLQMPLTLALGVRGTVRRAQAGRPGGGGGGGYLLPFQCIPGSDLPPGGFLFATKAMACRGAPTEHTCASASLCRLLVRHPAITQ